MLGGVFVMRCPFGYETGPLYGVHNVVLREWRCDRCRDDATEFYQLPSRWVPLCSTCAKRVFPDG